MFSQPAKPVKPDLRILGRTGDARYVPIMSTRSKDREGRVAAITNRYDEVKIREYDWVRMYPVVKDALSQIRTPLKKANFHFTCPRQDIADLAMQEHKQLIPGFIDQMVRGAHEFGYQAAEIRWTIAFEVSLSSGQAGTGAETEKVFPFIYRIKRFAYFDPNDTRPLIDSFTGDFAGIRQFVGLATQRDVPASKVAYFVNEPQFDSLYGIPRTKPAVPFVDLAQSNYDDLGRHSRYFAVGWKIGRHRPGFTTIGTDDANNPIQQDNGSTMEQFMSTLESGATVSLPAEYDRVSGHPLWDVTVTTVPGEENYVEKAEHLNKMIRIALCVPEFASSSSPQNGTYNLGSAVIDLFLENAQATLDDIDRVYNEQILAQWVLYNFGADAPPCYLVHEPLSGDVERGLLQALVTLLGSGSPLETADGMQLVPDWPKLAEDNGVPLIKVDASKLASSITAQAQQRLNQMQSQGGADQDEGEGDGGIDDEADDIGGEG